MGTTHGVTVALHYVGATKPQQAGMEWFCSATLAERKLRDRSIEVRVCRSDSSDSEEIAVKLGLPRALAKE